MDDILPVVGFVLCLVVLGFFLCFLHALTGW